MRGVLVALTLATLATACAGRVEGSTDGGEAEDAAPTKDGGQPADVTSAPDVQDTDGELLEGEAPPCNGPGGSAVLAHFQLVIDGVAQTTYACPASPWDYPAPPESNPSVVLANDGTVPIAYIARPSWNVYPPNTPGEPSGNGPQLYGVLDPGRKVDISSTFTATPANGYGIVAILGSASSFSRPVCLLSDQGEISWPPAVGGNGGASGMFVVQLAASKGCQTFSQFW
jgi:hypothetical protein